MFGLYFYKLYDNLHLFKKQEQGLLK